MSLQTFLRPLLLCLITICALLYCYFMRRFEGDILVTTTSPFDQWDPISNSNITTNRIARYQNESRQGKVPNANPNTTTTATTIAPQQPKPTTPSKPKITLRYDRAGQSLVTFGTSPSFPVEHRTKQRILFSDDLYGKSMKAKLGRKNIFQFVYNPTLLPLTDDSRRRIGIVHDNWKEAAYLGTFRISNFGNCRGPNENIRPTQRYRNYFGLGLLNRNLELIPKSSTYFRLPMKAMRRRIGPSKIDDLVRNSLQDCSLYEKHSRLHLICNGYMAPVTILSVNSKAYEHYNNNTRTTDALGPFEALVEFRRGAGILRLFLNHPWIPLKPNGKNLHIFEDIHNNTYLELWPTSPKQSVRIQLEEREMTMNSRVRFYNSTILTGELLNNENMSSSTSTLLPRQKPSFSGPKEAMWEPLSNPLERGTACCITLFLRDRDKANKRYDVGVGGDNMPIRVGVAHLKDKNANYLNRFYAFKPISPFREVAKSGLFCLGFGESDNTTINAPRVRPELKPQHYGNASTLNVWIVDRHYDCPRIQFVSGITEKVDDPNSVILSYGVNDCYPRMVVVSKDAILNLLFPNIQM